MVRYFCFLTLTMLMLEPACAAAFRDCSDVCPEMVEIPPGKFLMGGAPTEEA